MATYTPEQQRRLDQESGAELDRQAARWSAANPGVCRLCHGDGGWWSGHAGSSQLYWRPCSCLFRTPRKASRDVF